MRGGSSARSVLHRIAARVAAAWCLLAARSRFAAARTVLHAGRRRVAGGVRYRAWFADAARFERMVAPVTSFAWSLEVSAKALRFSATEEYFELGPVTPSEIDEFRRRFRPGRDEVVPVASPRQA